jgi:Mannosyltransferase (PIG-V)
VSAGSGAGSPPATAGLVDPPKAPPIERALARPSRWPGWAEAIVIGGVSRLFAAAVLWASYVFRIPTPIGRHWTSPLAIWDSDWYLYIVRNGYHADVVTRTQYGPGYHDFAFFPAYPAVVSVLSLGGLLDVTVVAPVVANLLFIAAAVPIFRVLERVGGRSYARYGLLLFAFSPAAYVYSLAYSEPLFLLFAGLFLLNIGPVRAGILGAFAMFTRLGGAALAAASLADLLKPETRRRGLVGIAAAVIAFAAWWLWIAQLTGNFMGYMLGSPSWYSADAPNGSPTGIASILAAKATSAWVPTAVWVTVIVLVLLTIGTISLFRKGQLRLGLYSAACVASTMLVTWNTMPRLAVVAFPAFGALGAILPNKWFRWGLFALSVVSEAVLGSLAIASVVVP